MPAYQDPGREFWESVFLQFVDDQGSSIAATIADDCLRLWQERWNHQITDCPIPPRFIDEMHEYYERSSSIQNQMANPAPSYAIEEMMAAQEKVEAIKKMLDSMRTLANQMPKELGEAYYSVVAAIAEQQLHDAENRLSNIQNQMENNRGPKAPATTTQVEESGTNKASSTGHDRSNSNQENIPT